jgi:hypothetical protein
VQYPDVTLQKRTMRALRVLTAGGAPLAGVPKGREAGIAYFRVNEDRLACGVSGLQSSEFESFFGVTMGTIRMRAARVESLLAVWTSGIPNPLSPSRVYPLETCYPFVGDESRAATD